MPGSFVQRRSSPVRVPAPGAEPWNDRYATITLWRPVTMRAILTASSFASPPLVVKKTRAPSSQGDTSERRAAKSLRVSFIREGAAYSSFSAWRLIASTTAGWPWPRLTATSPADRSR